MELFDLSTDQALRMAITSVLAYVSIIIYSRVFGLRSFSKMSGYEFAITVAFGSILASVITSKQPALGVGIFALGILFIIQKLVAVARKRSSWFQHMLDNYPLVLMYEGQFLEDNLNYSQVSKADVLAKLREANVTHLSQVRAVVLESTGDVSVLHGECEQPLDPRLMEDVRWSKGVAINEGRLPDPAAYTP